MQTLDPDMLKKLSKDEKSYEKLREIVEDLEEKAEKNADRLKLLEAAIRSDYDSILITDLNLEKPGPKIVYVNDGFCKMTGYSKEEVIGKTPRILQGPKTDQEVLKKLKQRLSEGQSFFGQTVNYRKDGSEFINQWDIHPLTDDDGNITHWVSYQHDISKRKRAEEQLIDMKIDFDGLHEMSKQTVVDVDTQGNIVMANKAFRELIGYHKNELKRIKIWDLFPERYMNSLKSRFDKQDEDAYFDGQEFKGIIKHKSGIPIQVKGNTQILDLKDQKLIRAVVENISLQKRVMETLEKRNFDYSRIVDKASEYTYEVQFEGDKPVFKAVSEEFALLTGLSIQAVQGKSTLSQFIHPDDIEVFKKHLAKVNEGRDSTCEYRLKSNGGDYIQVLDYAHPVWDGQEKEVKAVHGAVSVDEAYKKTET